MLGGWIAPSGWSCSLVVVNPEDCIGIVCDAEQEVLLSIWLIVIFLKIVALFIDIPIGQRVAFIDIFIVLDGGYGASSA